MPSVIRVGGPTPPPPHPSIVARVEEMLATAERPLFSFEFFPPASEDAERTLWTTIRELEALSPDFVSVTYGANGSTRDRTINVTRKISQETILRTMGHLTCVSQSAQDVRRVVGAYADAGVRHILAIRGDPPGGPTAPWEQHPEGLTNATELVRLVASLGNFSIGVAAFPDIHPDKRDPELDARILVDKAEAGATFAITQLFFEPDRYFELVERVRAMGCDLPIIPGIQPVTNIKQIERFAELSGATLPESMVTRLRAHQDDPASVRAIGLEVATELSENLLDGGAPGLHFFTLNRSLATRAIHANLKLSRAQHLSRPGPTSPVSPSSASGFSLPPVEVVRRFWAARLDDDRDAMGALLDPGVSWRVVGDGVPGARTSDHREAVLDDLGSAGSGSWSHELTNLIVAGNQVVTELRATMHTADGPGTVFDLVAVMRIADGRVVECREYRGQAFARVSASVRDGGSS